MNIMNDFDVPLEDANIPSGLDLVELPDRQYTTNIESLEEYKKWVCQHWY